MGPFNKSIFVLLIGLVAVFVQGSLIHTFFPGAIIPDLVLVMVVYLSFYDAGVLGAVLSFLLGLEYDFFSDMLIGPRAGSYTVVYALFASLSQRIFVESAFAAFVSVLFSSFLNSVVYLVLISGFKTTNSDIFSTSIFEALFTAVVGPILLRVLKRLLYKRPQGLTGGLRAVQV
jgi:rod shape-determining protein MreD